MSQPLALDLFCGAGGVCIGLQRAGFDVVGVDNVHQPDYPGDFVLAHGLMPPFELSKFDLIWASPPCPFASAIRNSRAKTTAVNLIPEVRRLLAAHPMTVIENVPPAVYKGPMRPDLVLRGRMFARPLARERVFELTFHVPMPFMNAPTLPGGRCLVSASGKGANDMKQVAPPHPEGLARPNTTR